jgi:hypothetical protein
MASLIGAANALPVNACKTYQGLEYILVADLASLNLVPDEDTGLIGITAKALLVLTDEWKRIDPVKDSAKLIDVPTGTRNTGGNSHKPTLTFSVRGIEADIRKMELAFACTNTVAIGVKWDGTAKLAGTRVGLTRITGADDSGQAPDDFSGYMFTLEGSEPNPMYIVDPAVLATLQAVV